MITNLTAAVLITITTNWVTVSRTTPVCTMQGCIVYHPTLYNQIGYRSTNTVAEFVWKGKTNVFVLESSQESVSCASQSIAEGPAWTNMMPSK